MSRLKEMQAFYPRTWKQRLAIEQYDGFQEWEGEEPITVTLHQVIQRYGGPHEGGWYWNQGFPEASFCVFNKKQAIKTFLEVCKEYEVWDQPDLGLSTTDYNWEVSFSNDYAKMYPTERPHYE